MKFRALGRGRWMVALVALVACMSVPVGSYAQTLYTGTPVPNVGVADPGDPGASGAQGFTSPAGRVGSARPAEVQSSSKALALTGADIGGLVAIGLGSLAAGLLLTRRGSRPTSG